MRSIDGDRRVADLELELMEQRKLYDRISAQNEDLREENYNYRERLYITLGFYVLIPFLENKLMTCNSRIIS